MTTKFLFDDILRRRPDSIVCWSDEEKLKWFDFDVFGQILFLKLRKEGEVVLT